MALVERARDEREPLERAPLARAPDLRCDEDPLREDADFRFAERFAVAARLPLLDARELAERDFWVLPARVPPELDARALPRPPELDRLVVPEPVARDPLLDVDSLERFLVVDSAMTLLRFLA